MARKKLALGEAGEVEATPQHRDSEGRWKRHPTGKGKGVERWRARAYYRGHDGVLADVTRVHARKAEAIAAAQEAIAARLRRGSSPASSPDAPLVAAGEAWLELIARSDSGKSPRTVSDYTGTYWRYVDSKGSTLRGLTLRQANEPARISAWLQSVADGHGTGSAKIARSVLSGILQQAVDDGVLSANGVRQVKPVKSHGTAAQETLKGPGRRRAKRDTQRAFTRAERDMIMSFADQQAALPAIDRVKAKRRATADLTAFMAATGVRISEARALRWEHLDLAAGTVEIHGTKSKSSKRLLSLPTWLQARMSERQRQTGPHGYVFPSPDAGSPEREWDQANCARAMSLVLKGAGFPWATPHTFRRTVATLLNEAGVPVARISDQLGHANPAMTASVYLGRDFEGDKSDLAELL